MTERRRAVILGAAGRDFHNFNVVFRSDPALEVVAFTATQIPFAEDRTYPPELAGPRYPRGIPIRPEAELEELIRRHRADLAVFAYSDVSHEHVMHRASQVLALGADFWLLGPDRTMLPARRPVISVCAVRTGCGKSAVARYVVKLCRERGLRTAVLRHPMPYGDLLAERSQRFRTPEDLDRASCTVEEREEYELHLRAGATVYAGVDYAEVLRAAEAEADVLVWDGGNNDFPFLRPDLELVVLDPHRPGHELAYHPGETNLRRAGVAVVNKIDTARPEDVAAVEANVRAANPRAAIVRLASPLAVETPEALRGRRVLAVEDGPTLTHGGMAYGAATLAARQLGAAELVDPRPHAQGSLREAYREYPHLGRVLPALGYSPEQLRELRETIEATPCDLVLVGTPVDLPRLLGLTVPAVRVRYEVEEAGGPTLRGHVERFLDATVAAPPWPAGQEGA
ncbi:MAG: cyclic 2,3-diphosphoglycerate synthase [Deferrisomatales bacterium]|nr:cyclic 2,3-diphosphoglycerate synthase [Deferrisomatales bacterium]